MAARSGPRMGAGGVPPMRKGSTGRRVSGTIEHRAGNDTIEDDRPPPRLIVVDAPAHYKSPIAVVFRAARELQVHDSCNLVFEMHFPIVLIMDFCSRLERSELKQEFCGVCLNQLFISTLTNSEITRASWASDFLI
nr:uncharacterized protein LOC109761722 [Aegilops tauschii subsp. strangulata]